MSVDLLVLGAGWTSTFLLLLCKELGIKFAATSRSGRDATIPFLSDPYSDDQSPYEVLPDAKTVLITFPIQKSGASQRLVKCYTSSRKNKVSCVGFIQLGATSIWDVSLPWMAHVAILIKRCCHPVFLHVSEQISPLTADVVTPGATDTRLTIAIHGQYAKMNYSLYLLTRRRRCSISQVSGEVNVHPAIGSHGLPQQKMLSAKK